MQWGEPIRGGGGGEGNSSSMGSRVSLSNMHHHLYSINKVQNVVFFTQDDPMPHPSRSLSQMNNQFVVTGVPCCRSYISTTYQVDLIGFKLGTNQGPVSRLIP